MIGVESYAGTPSAVATLEFSASGRKTARREGLGKTFARIAAGREETLNTPCRFLGRETEEPIESAAQSRQGPPAGIWGW